MSSFAASTLVAICDKVRRHCFQSKPWTTTRAMATTCLHGDHSLLLILLQQHFTGVSRVAQVATKPDRSGAFGEMPTLMTGQVLWHGMIGNWLF